MTPSAPTIGFQFPLPIFNIFFIKLKFIYNFHAFFQFFSVFNFFLLDPDSDSECGSEPRQWLAPPAWDCRPYRQPPSGLSDCPGYPAASHSCNTAYHSTNMYSPLIPVHVAILYEHFVLLKDSLEPK